MSQAMFERIALILPLLTLLSVPPVAADVLLLVHGYASDAQSWEMSGVNSELQSRGWPRAGIFTPMPAGRVYTAGPQRQSVNKSYSVNLPAEAPLLVQAAYLRTVLAALRRQHPEEKLTLVGHSAGGVVARLVLLGENPYRIDGLITIASPHLGTVRAAQGLDVLDAKPFFCPGPGIDLLKSVAGGPGYRYLKVSRGVLYDLLPAVSGSLLFWANRQPYPDIRYISIVRQTAYTLGDELVPSYSQNMNNVPALHGRVEVLSTVAGHGLNPRDGALLAEILGP